MSAAVAADIAKYRGVEVDPGNVLIVPGGKPTMFFAILMFGEPGAEILYPNPGFPIYESWVDYVRAEPVPLQLSEEAGFAFTADELNDGVVVGPQCDDVLKGTIVRALKEPDADGKAAIQKVFNADELAPPA